MRRRRVEDEYRQEHRAFFGPRVAWSRRVAFLLSRPALLETSLSLARTPAAGQFLLGHTRVERDEVIRLADHWFSIE